MRVNTALVLVPEAAAHFDDLPQACKDKVRFPRERRDVEPVTESHSVHQPAHGQLRRSVLRPDVSHVNGATLGRKFVGHTAKSKGRSAISFKRLPSASILTTLRASSFLSFSTLAISSGKAKW